MDNNGTQREFQANVSLHFLRPFDHAFLQRLITVKDKSGNPLKEQSRLITQKHDGILSQGIVGSMVSTRFMLMPRWKIWLVTTCIGFLIDLLSKAKLLRAQNTLHPIFCSVTIENARCSDDDSYRYDNWLQNLFVDNGLNDQREGNSTIIRLSAIHA